MVSRQAGTFAITLCTLSLFAFAGCNPTAASSTQITDGSVPFLSEVTPSSASPGTNVTLSGAGFAFAAPVNIVIIGDTAIAGETFQVIDDKETLSFTLSNDAEPGNHDLFFIVNGTPSNALSFEVTP